MAATIHDASTINYWVEKRQCSEGGSAKQNSFERCSQCTNSQLEISTLYNQYTEENFNGIYCGRDALLQLLLLLMLLLCSIIVKDTDEQYIELSGLHSTVGDGDE